jgi:hypothetical protein
VGAGWNKALDEALGPDIFAAILGAGLNLDLIDDGAIAQGGITHKILVLPTVTRAKIEEYRRKGGIVIANNELSKLKIAMARDVATAPEIGVAPTMNRGVIVFSQERELTELGPDTAAPCASDNSTNWKVSVDWIIQRGNVQRREHGAS